MGNTAKGHSMNETETSLPISHMTTQLSFLRTWEAVCSNGLEHFEEVDPVLWEGLQFLVDHVQRALKQCLKHLRYVVNHRTL